jgi:hypothetical protein
VQQQQAGAAAAGRCCGDEARRREAPRELRARAGVALPTPRWLLVGLRR